MPREAGVDTESRAGEGSGNEIADEVGVSTEPAGEAGNSEINFLSVETIVALISEERARAKEEEEEEGEEEEEEEEEEEGNVDTTEGTCNEEVEAEIGACLSSMGVSDELREARGSDDISLDSTTLEEICVSELTGIL